MFLVIHLFLFKIDNSSGISRPYLSMHAVCTRARLKPCSDTPIYRPTCRSDLSGRQIGVNKYMLSYDAVHTRRYVGPTSRPTKKVGPTYRRELTFQFTPICRRPTLCRSANHGRGHGGSRAHSVMSPVVIAT